VSQSRGDDLSVVSFEGQVQQKLTHATFRTPQRACSPAIDPTGRFCIASGEGGIFCWSLEGKGKLLDRFNQVPANCTWGALPATSHGDGKLRIWE
jgi:hypothetical protein